MAKCFVVPGYGEVPAGQDLVISVPAVFGMLTGIQAIRICVDRRVTVVRDGNAVTAAVDLAQHDVSTNEGLLRLAQCVELTK